MQLDRKLIGVLGVSLLCLIMIEGFAKARFQIYPFGQPANQFTSLMHWVAWCVLSYGLIPALFVVFVLREDLRDYGLRMGEVWRYAWAYLVMLAAVVPLAYFMSTRPNFQETYPFYRAASSNPMKFWIFQAGYACQFVCLEFFFRGFMVHGTEHRLGCYCVLLMTVPFCLIHLGKPTPEVYASVIAGIALGMLSLKTRSVFWGAAAHITVALLMDLLCLWRVGDLASVL